MVSLWFRHREGELRCATAADADVIEEVRVRIDPDLVYSRDFGERMAEFA